MANYDLNEVPNGEIILSEFENSKKLDLRIYIDGKLRNQKNLFEKAEKQNQIQSPSFQNSGQINIDTNLFLQNLISSSTTSIKEITNNLQDQFKTALQIINLAQEKASAEQSKNQTDMLNYMKDLNKQVSEKSEKEKEKQESYFKQLSENLQKSFEDKINFSSEQNRINLDHMKNMHSLELDKVKENHKLEVTRESLGKESSMSAKDWIEVFSETAPNIVQNIKEAVQVYQSVKDINVKAVN